MAELLTNEEIIMTNNKKPTESKKQKMIKLASETWQLDTLSQADRLYMERMLKEKCTERFLKLVLQHENGT